MPKVDLLNIEGKKVGNIELSDDIFAVEVNEDVMHEVVVNYLANQRQGSIRAPQWIKGGIALGPKPRSYKYTLNKKVKRLALKSALTTKVLENKIIVLDSLELEEIKTKAMANILTNLNVEKALVVLPESNFNVQASARNIPNVKTALVNTINTYDVLKYDTFVVTKAAVEKIEEVYA